MTHPSRLTIYNWINRLLPDCGCLNGFRCAFLRWCGVPVGKNCDISGTVSVLGWGTISIGNDVRIHGGGQLHVAGGNIKIGNDVLIGSSAIIESFAEGTSGGCVEVGNNVDIMMQSILSANGNARVRIGNNCKIAHNVSIKATHHKIDIGGECIGGDMVFDDISISDGCWVCAGAIVTPGVHVGRKNVIGAGAVVICDTPDNVLVAGVPAEVKKVYAK